MLRKLEKARKKQNKEVLNYFENFENWKTDMELVVDQPQFAPFTDKETEMFDNRLGRFLHHVNNRNRDPVIIEIDKNTTSGP